MICFVFFKSNKKQAGQCSVPHIASVIPFLKITYSDNFEQTLDKVLALADISQPALKKKKKTQMQLNKTPKLTEKKHQK